MWQMPPGSPPATFSRRLLRKQHTDADRLTFREFSPRGSSKWRRGIFVTETKRSSSPAQQKTREKQRKALLQKPFVVSAAKAALFAGVESGVTKSLTQNGNNRARRWIYRLSSCLHISARIPNWCTSTDSWARHVRSRRIPPHRRTIHSSGTRGQNRRGAKSLPGDGHHLEPAGRSRRRKSLGRHMRHPTIVRWRLHALGTIGPSSVGAAMCSADEPANLRSETSPSESGNSAAPSPHLY